MAKRKPPTEAAQPQSNAPARVPAGMVVITANTPPACPQCTRAMAYHKADPDGLVFKPHYKCDYCQVTAPA